MKGFKKRVMAFILSIAIVCSFIPTSVLAEGTITITTTSLENGVALRSYSQTLEAEGEGTITWSITDGSLPDGLKLDYYTGEISGAPIKVGQYEFTVTATNESGDTDSKEFTMDVDYVYTQISGFVKDFNGNPIENATVTLLDKDKNIVLDGNGDPVTTQTDKMGKYTFSGDFKYGKHYIKVNKENYSEAEIEFLVTNSAYQYPDDIILNSESATITTETLGNCYAGRSYYNTLKSEGGSDVTWSITEGSLPNGLELDSATGEISGVPTKVGQYAFTVTATNSKSGATDSKEFTMEVGYLYIQISGFVKDSNGNPIENATVTLLDKDGTVLDTTQTDKMGKYTFSGDFKYGKHYIKVNKENYSEAEIEYLITIGAYQYPDDIILTLNYEITEGSNSVWEKGSSEGLRFVCNGEYDKFTGIMIDDQAISSDYYTSEKGSTVITLSASYLETLSLGEHKLTMDYQDGSAETTFTIKEASVNPSEPTQNGDDIAAQNSETPKTGDNAFIGFLMGLIALSVVLVTTSIFMRRRRSSK